MRATHENDQTGIEVIAFIGCFGYCRIFYFYGVSDMKGYEVLLYEDFCKRCKKVKECPWLCMSNDTCFEMTAFEERKENERDEREKTH